MVTPTKKSHIQELNHEEARQLLDAQSLRNLGVSLDQFIHAWFAGDYGEPDDNPDALELATLLPGIGIDPWPAEVLFKHY